MAKRLFAVGSNAPAAVWVTSYEAHPDGGFTPLKEEDKGTLTIPCPFCDTPLVREVNERALGMMSLNCPACHRRSVGAQHPHRVRCSHHNAMPSPTFVEPNRFTCPDCEESFTR